VDNRTLDGLLRRHEGPLGAPSERPVVWCEAQGSWVVDADGRRLLDLSAGFGVASVGHRNPRVVAAVKAQADRLLHGLGDLHGTDVRARLAERLAREAPFGLSRVLFHLTGAGAVELALKTALLATGRGGLMAFEAGYHGTALGALLPGGWPALRAPFGAVLPPPRLVPYGEVPALAPDVAAVLVEPLQNRGGVRSAPPGFLAALRAECDRTGALLVVDEVFTGLGRTGAMWMSEADGVRPDLLVIGKALGGGLPLAACLGSPELMDAAWAGRAPYAIDTHTHLGSPLSCAAALAVLDEVVEGELPARAAAAGARIAAALPTVRGRGLALGVPCDAVEACERLLERGLIAVPAGLEADVLELSPPLSISDAELDFALPALAEVLS
jgi:4-aminobutyrate aminotransferase-like enzyme